MAGVLGIYGLIVAVILNGTSKFLFSLSFFALEKVDVLIDSF